MVIRRMLAGVLVAVLSVGVGVPVSAQEQAQVDVSVETQAVDPGVFCGFVDVPYDAFYTNATCWLTENGITNGTSASTYSPSGNVTRAQMAAFLWRAAGKPAAPNKVFKDEASIPGWASSATDWLWAQGLTNNDPYNPAGDVTRAQMAAFLWRAAGSPAAPDKVFKDEASIPGWARPATDWLFDQGITVNDPYNPTVNVTRAQMATFLYRNAGSPALSADTISNTDGSAAVLWYNTRVGEGRTITLPIHGAGNITVNWGDGTTQNFTNPVRPTKTYAADGYYRVKVTGSATDFGFAYQLDDPAGNLTTARHLLAVSSFGNLGSTTLDGGFYGATELVRAPKVLPSTVTSLSETFSGPWSNSLGYYLAPAKFNDPAIGGWNTANVTNMNGTFFGVETFNQPIGNWNTSKVTSMIFMFAATGEFNQPIGNWNTTNVTDMSWMFAETFAFNQPIGTWNTSKVTDMSRMFSGAIAFDQNISGWNVGAVTNWDGFGAFALLSTANTPPKFR